MNSNILISENLEKRIDEIQKILSKLEINQNHPDLLYLNDEETLGVEAAKKIRQFLSLKPFQAKGRVVVLESAQNLTIDAQNSLLKTLEEPPSESSIILGADSDTKLLPTIISRCEIIRVQVTENRVQDKKDFKSAIEHLVEASIEERFEFIEKLEEKEGFLKALIKYYRKELAFQSGIGNLEYTKELLEAERWNKANVNIRAILEYLMFTLPSKNK